MAFTSKQDMDYEGARGCPGAGAPSLVLSIETIEQPGEPCRWMSTISVWGPVFATATKMDAEPRRWGCGMQRYRAITRQTIVALEGSAGNARQAIDPEPTGVAIVSAICAAEDPGGPQGNSGDRFDAALESHRRRGRTQ